MSPLPWREASAAIVTHYEMLKNVLVCACTSLNFQLSKNSKNLTFFVSYEWKLKPWFSNVHCFRKFHSHAHVQHTEHCADDIRHFLQCRRSQIVYARLFAVRTNLSKTLDVYFILSSQLAVYTLWPWCDVPCLYCCYSIHSH